MNKDKSMPWKQDAVKIGKTLHPSVNMTMTNVHKDNQAKFLEENNLTLTEDQAKLAAMETTDFIVLSKGGKTKAVLLSPPDSDDVEHVFHEAGNSETDRAVVSLLMNLYS